MSKFDYINKSLSEFTKNDKPEFRWRQSANQYGELRWRPNKIKELARSFTNAQQMKDFIGENQEQIRQAGGYIMSHKVERPEWFDEIYEAESLEECLIIAKQYNDFSIFYNKEKRIYQRLYWFLGDVEMKKTFKEWMTGFPTEYTDDIIYSLLKKYSSIPEAKKDKENRKYIIELQVEKNKKYPKSWKLYESMKTTPGNKKGLKRSGYQQRTPAIEKYDLDNNLIKTFNTWEDVTNAGYNRNSVTNAIRGNDGHHRHKGFIWKYKEVK